MSEKKLCQFYVWYLKKQGDFKTRFVEMTQTQNHPKAWILKDEIWTTNLHSTLYDHTFQVPKMEESSPIYAACKAYVKENPPPKLPYKVQYLHFRYLKLLVIIYYTFSHGCRQTPPIKHHSRTPPVTTLAHAIHLRHEDNFNRLTLGKRFRIYQKCWNKSGWVKKYHN